MVTRLLSCIGQHSSSSPVGFQESGGSSHVSPFKLQQRRPRTVKKTKSGAAVSLSELANSRYTGFHPVHTLILGYGWILGTRHMSFVGWHS